MYLACSTDAIQHATMQALTSATAPTAPTVDGEVKGGGKKTDKKGGGEGGEEDEEGAEG